MIRVFAAEKTNYGSGLREIQKRRDGPQIFRGNILLPRRAFYSRNPGMGCLFAQTQTENCFKLRASAPEGNEPNKPETCSPRFQARADCVGWSNGQGPCFLLGVCARSPQNRRHLIKSKKTPKFVFWGVGGGPLGGGEGGEKNRVEVAGVGVGWGGQKNAMSAWQSQRRGL